MENGEAVSRPLLKRKGFRFSVKGATAGALVVLGAAVAAWWVWPEGERAGETPAPRNAGHIKEVTPAAAPQTEAQAERGAAPVRAARREGAEAPAGEKKGIMDLPNTNGWIVTDAPKPEVEFDSMFEQQLNWIFTTEPGDSPPPQLEITDEDMRNMAQILITKLKVNEKDSDTAVDCKETVNLAKKELIKFIKEGGAPEDFIKHYWKVLDDANKKWEQANEKVRASLKMEEPEIVKQYIRDINKELADEGIKPAFVPRGFRQKYWPEALDEEDK